MDSDLSSGLGTLVLLLLFMAIAAIKGKLAERNDDQP
jgi:hypothetical protein